jgi:hypothetical protein
VLAVLELLDPLRVALPAGLGRGDLDLLHVGRRLMGGAVALRAADSLGDVLAELVVGHDARGLLRVAVDADLGFGRNLEPDGRLGSGFGGGLGGAFRGAVGRGCAEDDERAGEKDREGSLHDASWL